MAILRRIFLDAVWPTPLGRRSRAWVALTVLLLAGNLDLSAQTISKDYQVKAGFLFKFPQFIEWPEAAFPDKETSLVIGVLGDDPFRGFLSEMVRDEKVGSRPLRVEYYRRIEDVKDCHILFISSSGTQRLEQILAKLKNRSILTVGETDGFATNGGMVKFVTEGTKIRFRINNEAARAASLTISSKLLRLAEVVVSPKR